MTLKTFAENLLPNKRIQFWVRFLTLEILALIINFFLVIAIAYVVGSIPALLDADMVPPVGASGLDYSITTGVIIAIFAGISLCFSLPLAVVTRSYIFKNFFIKRTGGE